MQTEEAAQLQRERQRRLQHELARRRERDLAQIRLNRLGEIILIHMRAFGIKCRTSVYINWSSSPFEECVTIRMPKLLVVGYINPLMIELSTKRNSANIYTRMQHLARRQLPDYLPTHRRVPGEKVIARLYMADLPLVLSRIYELYGGHERRRLV